MPPAQTASHEGGVMEERAPAHASRRGRTVFLYVMGSEGGSKRRTAWWNGGYWGSRMHVKVGITHDLKGRLDANRRIYGWRIGADTVCWAIFDLGDCRDRANRIETCVLRSLRLWQKVLHQRSHRVKLCEDLGEDRFARNYSGRSEVFNMSVGEAVDLIRRVLPVDILLKCPPEGSGPKIADRSMPTVGSQNFPEG